MRLLPTAAAGLVAALVSVTEAHTSFTTLFINDVNQGDGTCVRQPRNPATSTNPVIDVTSTDMVCGRDGLTPVAFTCPAPPSAKLTFLFRANPDGSAPGVIDKSHKGPCAVYLKAVASPSATPAQGPGWFKIWDEGYDESARKWCTEKLMTAGGLLSVRLPDGLPGGAYLVRPELLALHNAPQGEPQFYLGCAQIFVASPVRGPLALPADRAAAIPGAVRPGEPAVAFNVYTSSSRSPGSYTPPGPPVFTPPRVRAGGPAPAQTEGAIPTGVACLLKNANWCGAEVGGYSGEAGCWRAADACFAQEQACDGAAPPSGDANCRVWARKCRGIQDACERGQFRGPPDAGKRLVEVFAPVPGVIPPAP